MRIEHVALWTRDLERMRAFYERHLGARANGRYESSTRRGFVSYFLSFEGGARLEIMALPDLHEAAPSPAVGYAHVAFTLGSREAVDAFALRARADGVPILSGPRVTGDGYYEVVIEDPDGNAVEVTG